MYEARRGFGLGKKEEKRERGKGIMVFWVML
jgi:hypothetical protein